jgi:hypothetical protein
MIKCVTFQVKESIMQTNTLKIIIAIFFLAHAFIHISLSWAPIPKPDAMRTPFFPSWKRSDADPKWPISKLGLPANLVQIAGSILFLAVTIAFCLAALGLLGVPGLNSVWIPLVVGASIVSIVLITLFWHPWLPAGIILDIAILAAIYFHFPASLFINN